MLTMVAFGPSPIGSVPLTQLSPSLAHPNTRGNVCINFTNTAFLLSFTNGQGIAQTLLQLTPPVRAALQGASPIDIWYQGFLLNVAGSTSQLELHATGCGIQHL
ncbi:MAG: hypothetical protein Fur0037_27250 [Planctomycetota bacterium]